MSDNNANIGPEEIPNVPIPEKLPDELVPLYQWWVQNGKSYMTAVIIGLVIAMGIVYFKNYKARLNASASTAAFNASGVEELETANSDFGGTASGPVIRLRLAKAYYDEQRFDEAAAAYRQFADENSSSPLLDSALLGEAVALEAQDKFDEAQAVFEKVIAKGEASANFRSAVVGKARCLAAADKKSEAKDLISSSITDKEVSKELCKIIDRYTKPAPRKAFSLGDLSGSDGQDALAPEAEVPADAAPAAPAAAPAAAPEAAPAAAPAE